MENVKSVSSWEECEELIRELEHTHNVNANKVIFRGQSNAKWLLETTLERLHKNVKVEKYYRLISRIHHEIEAYNGREWSIPSYEEIHNWSMNYDAFTIQRLLAYDYLAHLRHHGFPSPLLDWSESPYVAAFFAFSNSVGADNIAIYVFSERPNRVKSGSSDKPQIFTVGHYVKTHRRHFRQQSVYTYCAQFFPSGSVFVSHQSVLQKRKSNQDVLWKIMIPASEREKVLRLLDRFNLNAFSLFDSEESLMKTLAFREIDNKPGTLD